MTNLLKSNKFNENSDPNFASSGVYKLVTKDIEVSVKPEFINSQAGGVIGDLYIWTYNVKIRNLGNQKVRLINRHWRITDEKGGVQKVDGEGVVGKQPEISLGGVFEYDSGVHLSYPSGIMSGYYEMINEDKEMFKVQIPSFSLDVSSIKNRVH